MHRTTKIHLNPLQMMTQNRIKLLIHSIDFLTERPLTKLQPRSHPLPLLKKKMKRINRVRREDQIEKPIHSNV